MSSDRCLFHSVNSPKSLKYSVSKDIKLVLVRPEKALDLGLFDFQFLAFYSQSS